MLCPLYSICAGQHFAESSLHIAMASILAVFDISNARDMDGNAITPEFEVGGTLVWCAIGL